MTGHGYRAFLEEMLAPLGGVAIRRMFGGLGLFRDRLMFGLVVRDVLYFKEIGLGGIELYFLALGATGVFSRGLIGRWADRIGRMRAIGWAICTMRGASRTSCSRSLT